MKFAHANAQLHLYQSYTLQALNHLSEVICLLYHLTLYRIECFNKSSLFFFNLVIISTCRVTPKTYFTMCSLCLNLTLQMATQLKNYIHVAKTILKGSEIMRLIFKSENRHLSTPRNWVTNFLAIMFLSADNNAFDF